MATAGVDAIDQCARVGSELGAGLRVTHVLASNAIGPTLAVDSAEHGAVVAELLRAEHAGTLAKLFVEGARRAAALDHPAAVPVLAEGSLPGGEVYVVRPRWEGETAEELIRRRPARIPPVEALRIAGDLLEVLVRAHAQGLTHGAIHPADVFIVDDGSVRLLGLGHQEVRRRIAEATGALSTPVGFAAPEIVQAPGSLAGEASDVWSVGAVLFALLTGESPYEGKTEAERRLYALERPPRMLTELFGESSLALARLVDSALESDPARRLSALRMRLLVREVAQLPELFLLRDLRTQQSPSPVSGPRRSPSAELATRATAPAPPPLRSVETVPGLIAVPGVADTIPAMPRVDSPVPSHHRRRIADVLVGEATASDADVRVLSELCQRLERAIVARRSAGDEAPARLAEFVNGAQAALSASSGGFVWNVAAWGFFAGKHAIWAPEGAAAEVPYRLYRDGVRSFGLLAGVEARELGRWVEIAALDDDEVGSEDDRATLLGAAGFQHVIFRAVEVAAAEPAERRLAKARQREQIALLAAFDTSAQLEDCWRDVHEAGAPALEPLPQLAASERTPAALRELELRLRAELEPDAERTLRVATAALDVATQAGTAASIEAHIERVRGRA